MMSNPEFVRQILNPGTMRQVMQMQQMMGGMGAGGFPGAADTICMAVGVKCSAVKVSELLEFLI